MLILLAYSLEFDDPLIVQLEDHRFRHLDDDLALDGRYNRIVPELARSALLASNRFQP